MKQQDVVLLLLPLLALLPHYKFYAYYTYSSYYPYYPYCPCYPYYQVIRDVSFELKPGTVTALVGHSGGGKRCKRDGKEGE